MSLDKKLGTFVQYAEVFSSTDTAGNLVGFVEAGVTVVRGPFRLMAKTQIARVVGIITPSMTNTADAAGRRVYEFQGNGWRPQGQIGDILLQDVENHADQWACGYFLFDGTGWAGVVQEDSVVAYAKPGKPTLALELPEGTVVKSREGSRAVGAGCYLAVSNADKGDFYVWTPDVVAKYVRDYLE